MTAAEWITFLGIWTLAGLPLGPNAANCILVASRLGVARAHWCVVGILAASVVFQALVFLGVASILATVAGLFSIVKLLGAAYLLWLAYKLWTSTATLPSGGEAIPLDGRFGLARDAFFISLSNPKAILSYAAVFSQFIDPDVAIGTQALLLTPAALIVTGLIYSGYCLLGMPLRRALTSVRRVQLLNRVVAGFFATGAGAIILHEARR